MWQPSSDNNGRWQPFFKLEACLRATLSTAGCHARLSKFKLKIMPLLSAEGYYTRLGGQHCPLRTYHSVFFKGGEFLWDLNRRLFLMNKKGRGESAALGRAALQEPSVGTDLGTQQDQIIPPLQRSIGLLPDPQENTCKCVKNMYRQSI